MAGRPVRPRFFLVPVRPWWQNAPTGAEQTVGCQMDDARSLGPGGQLPQAHFTDADLRRARFTRRDLGEVQMRAVELGGARIDGTWFSAGSQGVFLNDVEITGFVEQQLNRRFPGRELRRLAARRRIAPVLGCGQRPLGGRLPYPG